MSSSLRILQFVLFMFLTTSVVMSLTQFNSHGFKVSEYTKTQDSDGPSKNTEIVEDVHVEFSNPGFSFFEFEFELGLTFPQYVFLDEQIYSVSLLRPPLVKVS